MRRLRQFNPKHHLSLRQLRRRIDGFVAENYARVIAEDPVYIARDHLGDGVLRAKHRQTI